MLTLVVLVAIPLGLWIMWPLPRRVMAQLKRKRDQNDRRWS